MPSTWCISGRASNMTGCFRIAAIIEVAQILSPDRIRMRVWERGAGITEACGSGACATLVAAVRRGLAQRKATIVLDGGELDIVWREEDGHVVHDGPRRLVLSRRTASRFWVMTVSDALQKDAPTGCGDFRLPSQHRRIRGDAAACGCRRSDRRYYRQHLRGDCRSRTAGGAGRSAN